VGNPDLSDPERPRGLVVFPADSSDVGQTRARAADWWPVLAALVIGALVIAAALLLR
jgi:hypothetical protein